MAISRMPQPRQLYGLGSFVKKVTRKVTKPITKVASKIVPKEIAGIMRVAAPFLPAGYREAAYLLGTAKQTGRISPIDLALTLAPTIGKIKVGDAGQTISSRLGAIKAPFTGGKSIGEVLVGKEAVPLYDDLATMSDPTRGILGTGGEMFKFGGEKGVIDQFRDFKDKTTLGNLLLANEDGGFSKSKIAGVGVGLLSLVQNSKTPEEAGNNLAAATGNSDDYERGYQLFSQLTPELFEVPEQFRMQVQDGGLMRTKFASGTPKPVGGFNDKYLSPEYADEFKKFLQELREQNKKMEMDTIMEMFKQKMRKQDPILEAKDGGLMRTKFAKGSDDDEFPLGDPTAPINPFKPKPTGPVLPDKAEKENMMMAGSDRYQRILEQLINELESRLGRELTDAEYDMVGKLSYDKLSDPDFAVGGRVNYALGTKPTAEESGLGGLPIEADMRYTGGFMPYGAKEKADDVPARLSKNEFVFTADAVRAAGGGSVNKGAKKMYQTMKQLEAKPEAKGMTA